MALNLSLSCVERGDSRHQYSFNSPRSGAKPMTGTIKTLRADKGFGFIRDTTGKEVFFHSSAIYGEGIDNLREGDGVEFDLGEDGPKGPRATNVRRTTT
jgi:CspA family cold shock protein